MDQQQQQQQQHQQQPEHPHTLIAKLIGVALVTLVLTIGIGVLLGWVWAFCAFCLGVTLAVILWRYPHHHRHHHAIAMERRQQHLIEDAMQLTQELTLKHHYTSSLRLADGREWRWESPWCVPDGPLTIKDVTLGGRSEQALLPVGLPTAPPFSSLIGQVRPGHLFLGQGMSGEIWGDVTDLLSTLNIGRPGTGKSTLLRNVTGQLLEIGGKPFLFDPHGSILDDLGDSTSFDCAESPREIIDSSRWLEQTLNQRLIQRRAGNKNFQPLLVMADEMPVIAGQAPQALAAIKRIVSEGRKVFMFCIISGVGCPAEVMGSSLVRDAMASRYVFLTTTRQASMAGIETEVAKPLLQQLEEAGPGRAILGRVGHKPELVALPHATVADIRSLVPGVVPDHFPGGSQVVPDTSELSNGNHAGKQAEVDSGVLAVVRTMVLSGASQNKIIDAAFPHMRAADAAAAYRVYLSHLVKEQGEQQQ